MVTHEEFVAKYQGHAFYSIYPITGFIVFLSIAGIFGNFNIVWASIRKNSLRSHCNLLIALGAFADIFHQLAHFVLGYYVFTNRNFSPLNQCYWLQFLPVFWMNFGGFIVLTIGLDRFYSILKPTSYQNLNSHLYLSFILLFPLVFSIFLNYTAYKSVLKEPNVAVICVIAEAYHAQSKGIWSLAMLMVNSSIIIVYLGVWILIWIRSGSGRIDRRIMRSLTFVMFLVLLGWFSTSLAMTIGVMKGLDEEQMFKVHLNVGWAVNFSIAANYPVYFAFCKEYRRAFVEQLEILYCGPLVNRTLVRKLITSTQNTMPSTTNNAGLSTVTH